MKKYIKLDLTEIRYFEDDVDVGSWVDLLEYRPMTGDEVLRHETPKPSNHHTEWDGKSWVDVRPDDEKLEYTRSQYPSLTRYQFMRGMLEYGYKSSDIEAQIMRIEDEYTRELTMLSFKDAGYFDRNDQSIGVMRDVLGKTDLEIDEFWEFASNL